MVFALYDLSYESLIRTHVAYRTKQWIWLPVISLCILCGLTGAVATSASLLLDTSLSAREGLIKCGFPRVHSILLTCCTCRWVTVWLSGCVGADTVITAVLLWKFRTLKTSFSDTKRYACPRIRMHT